jgi:hypothetical protein
MARLVGIHTDTPDRVVYGQHEEFVQLILQRYNIGLIRPSLLTGCKVSGGFPPKVQARDLRNGL